MIMFSFGLRCECDTSTSDSQGRPHYKSITDPTKVRYVSNMAATLGIYGAAGIAATASTYVPFELRMMTHVVVHTTIDMILLYLYK